MQEQICERVSLGLSYIYYAVTFPAASRQTQDPPSSTALLTLHEHIVMHSLIDTLEPFVVASTY